MFLSGVAFISYGLYHFHTDHGPELINVSIKNKSKQEYTTFVYHNTIPLKKKSKKVKYQSHTGKYSALLAGG